MASSCTCTPKFYQRLGREVIVFEFDWTADTDGSFDSVSTDDYSFGNRTLTDIVKGKAMIGAKTVPNSVTAPTDSYDVSIIDEDNWDILEEAAYNRSSTKTEVVKLLWPVRVEGALTIDILNNSVNSGEGKLKLFFL